MNPGGRLPAEWWERLGRAVRVRLATWPRTTRVMRVALATCFVVVLVACVFEPDCREAVRVWVPCFVMLLAWTFLLPTRTLRWPSIARIFVAAMVWAGVVACLSSSWSQIGALSRSSDGPGTAIAGLVEETFKLAPSAAFAALAPGRVRRFAAADWFLVGLASGMGFQAAEDAVRQAVYKPGLLDFGTRPWSYGWTLFGGSVDSNGAAGFPGHQITTALVAVTIGFAAHATLRRRKRWPLMWLIPVGMWAVVVCDHIAYNATGSDSRYPTAPSSHIPQAIHDLWAATGHGFGLGWLLLFLSAVVLIVDAGVLVASGRSTVAEPAPSGLAVRAARAATVLAERVEAVGREVGGRVACVAHISAGVDSPTPLTPAWLLALLRELLARRSARESAMAVDGQVGRRVTRGAALVVGIGGAVGSVAAAVSLARHIGTSVDAGPAWFAGLLDSLSRWWDGMGPGGHGLVIGGALTLLAGAALVLAPEIVIPAAMGIGADGALLGPMVVPVAVQTVAGTAIAGIGTLAMADGVTSGGGATDDDSPRTSHDDASESTGDADGSVADRIANGHSYQDHVIEDGQFPEIESPAEFSGLVQETIDNATDQKPLQTRRYAYWDGNDGTLVITDPGNPDGGTAMRPDDGFEYYQRLKGP